MARPPVRARIGAIAVAAVLTGAVVIGGIVALRHQPSQPSATTSPVIDQQTPQVVDLDGSTTATLPPLPEGAYAPALAPDGTTLAFVVRIGGSDQIVVRGTGGDEQILPAGLAGSFPVWSPDGTAIAFQGQRPGREDDIYVVNVASRFVQRLTTSPFKDELAAWSPDGTTIAYVNDGTQPTDASGSSPTTSIWTVPTNGGEPRQLIDREGASGPTFAPDGQLIAFQTPEGLWSAELDGSNVQQLADVGARPAGPGRLDDRVPVLRSVVASHDRDLRRGDRRARPVGRPPRRRDRSNAPAPRRPGRHGVEPPDVDVGG